MTLHSRTSALLGMLFANVAVANHQTDLVSFKVERSRSLSCRGENSIINPEKMG